MSTLKKYLCKGCPGTITPSPVPYLGDRSGEQINAGIRSLRRSDNEQHQSLGERACVLIQANQCAGPREQVAVGYDSEGEFRIPGKTDTVCGRPAGQILEIVQVITEAN